MNVEVRRPNDPLRHEVDVAVVIDVFRATTTAAVICERFGSVRLLARVQDLHCLPRAEGDIIVFSELEDLPPGYRQVDNSPTIAHSIDLGTATPVLISTNGTVVVSRCVTAKTIVLASLINFSACVDYLRSKKMAAVSIVPAGSVLRKETAIEDELCADALKNALLGRMPPLGPLVADIRRDALVKRRIENEPGLQADIEFSLDYDTVDVVPLIVPAAQAQWYDATCAA